MTAIRLPPGWSADAPRSNPATGLIYEIQLTDTAGPDTFVWLITAQDDGQGPRIDLRLNDKPDACLPLLRAHPDAFPALTDALAAADAAVAEWVRERENAR